jgi:hypothetical protein
MPAQKRASGDQMFKMVPQLHRHLPSHEQDPQLKIAEEGIVRKIGARKKGLFVYDGRLGVQLARLSEQIEFSLFHWPIENLCPRLQVGREGFERVVR